MAFWVFTLGLAAAGTSCPSTVGGIWVANGDYSGLGHCENTSTLDPATGTTSSDQCGSFVHFTAGQIDRITIRGLSTVMETITHVGQIGTTHNAEGQWSQTMNWGVSELQYGSGMAHVRLDATLVDTTSSTRLEGPLMLIADFSWTTAGRMEVTEHNSQRLTLTSNDLGPGNEVDMSSDYKGTLGWAMDVPDSEWPQ